MATCHLKSGVIVENTLFPVRQPAISEGECGEEGKDGSGLEPSLFECGPFEIRMPAAQTVPLVFNTPHSGRVYPPQFLAQSRLDERRIRKSEDFYVDELFAPAIRTGAPLLMAHFPRAFLDVNREPYELDPKMFAGRLPPYVNVASTRVAGGLGTIPRLVAENMEIYAARLPVAEGLSRIETYYRPYHAALRRLVVGTRQRFGHALLFDCHSMPSTVRSAGTPGRPDFILGDRFGTSAAQELTAAAATVLQELGYNVARNRPYAGGFITEHYGRPAKHLHALQIEVNRGLYFDEDKLEKKPDFPIVAADIARFIETMAALFRVEITDRPLAAE